MIQLKSKDVSRVREEILAEQNGRCWICGQKPDAPCLDHHHIKRVKGTGRIRGVLCRACNVFLGKSENNATRYGIQQVDLPDILRAMADYLQKPQYKMMHHSEAPKKPKLQKKSYKKLLTKLKAMKYNKKIPTYPKLGYLTKSLDLLYGYTGVKPQFYKKGK